MLYLAAVEQNNSWVPVARNATKSEKASTKLSSTFKWDFQLTLLHMMYPKEYKEAASSYVNYFEAQLEQRIKDVRGTQAFLMFYKYKQLSTQRDCENIDRDDYILSDI